MSKNRDEVIEAIKFLIHECSEMKRIYDKAIKLGATQVTIPLEIGETGHLNLRCCDETHDVELTIYEHMIWACPKCRTVWAIRNMAVGTDEEELECMKKECFAPAVTADEHSTVKKL